MIDPDEVVDQRKSWFNFHPQLIIRLIEFAKTEI